MAQGEPDSELPQTEEEWKEELDEEQFRILRQAGTEPRFSGEYVDETDEGAYVCGGCGTELFSSETKFDSGCGWPSFYAANEDNVERREDDSLGRTRTEILCATCGGHLGHVFDDGPEPTGKRFCINSAALGFEEDEE